MSSEHVTAVGPALDGKVAVVTGGSRGLGRAYAEALAEAGAQVVVVGRRAEPLEQLIEEGGAHAAVVGDVRDPSVARDIAELATSRFGRLDVLVNNAGALRDRTLLKMSDVEFDDVVGSHVYGTFYVTRACARVMRDAGHGAIVNIGSDSGFVGAIGQSNYAAAKAAVLGLTLTWARELRRYGITCNCVLPNALTAMTEHLPEVLAAYGYGPPGETFPRSLGEASEVAPLIVMLANQRWPELTGQFLSLGGDKLSIWNPPAETQVIFMQGGWSVAELERSLATALELHESS